MQFNRIGVPLDELSPLAKNIGMVLAGMGIGIDSHANKVKVNDLCDSLREVDVIFEGIGTVTVTQFTENDYMVTGFQGIGYISYVSATSLTDLFDCLRVEFRRMLEQQGVRIARMLSGTERYG